MKTLRWLPLVLCAALLFSPQAAFGAFDEPGKTLFLDSFDSLKTDKGVLSTQPSSFVRLGGVITGVVSGGSGELVEGKKGRALKLSGDSRVIYANFDAINLLGGEASFWVRLNFDPDARDERTKTVLRNQLFLTFMAEDGSLFDLYTCLKDVSFSITAPDRNMILAQAASVPWKQGEWHFIRLVWGNALELWIDGEKRLSRPWDGLFGPLPVQKEKLRLYIGHYGVGYVNSEFTMDELTIQGPQPGNLACRPRATVPLLDGAPTLDGKLDDPFWKRAGKVSGFVGFSRRELSPEQPEFLLAYTDSALCIGAKIPLPEGRRPRATHTAHNANVYEEDSLELLLQPSPASPAFYHFAANAIGTKAEVRWSDAGVAIKEYSPEWQVATSSKEGEWIAEALIPFKALGLAGPPKPGDLWGGNFIADSSIGWGAARTWAFTDGNFVQPMTFGQLLFMGKARTLRAESFTGFAEGSPMLRLDLAGDFPPVITAKAEIFDRMGKSVRDTSARMNDSTSVLLGTQFLQGGLYTARFSAVDEANTDFLRQNVQFRVANAFALQIANYPYAGVAEVAASLGPIQDKVKQVVVQLLSPAGQTLATESVDRFDRGVARAKLPSGDLAPGDYIVQAAALDAQGKSVERAKQGLKIFPKPSWWKNNIGMDHSVPPPWTAVTPTAEGYGVWGREYQFDNSVFPRQIISQNKPLLSAAPRLLLRVAGKETDLLTLPRDSARQEFKDQAELSAQADVAGVSVRARGTLEFDGCYRFDLELAPNGANAVEGLVLELPLTSEVAQFLLASNGSSCSISEIKGDYSGPFTPYLWLGNDDMGLAFFSESDQFWNPRTIGAVQLLPSAERVLLRINVLRAPLPLKKPISYSFGLMASPVRPVIAGDPFVWMLYENDVIHPQYSFPEHLRYSSAGALSPEQGTLEFWARRTKNDANTIEIFSIAGGDPKAGSLRCNVSSAIYVDLNQTRLLTAPLNLSATEFSHIALTWTGKAVSLYVNGRRAATAEPVEAFRGVMQSASLPGGSLRFGTSMDSQGVTGVEVDDIRLSARARYEGDAATPPASPLAKDADTRLLDPLDERFLPDGQDASTAAGGKPSIGARFVQGKFGQALHLETGIPRPAEEVIKALNATVALTFNWNADVQKVGWPPVMFIENRPTLKKEAEQYHALGLKFLPYAAYPAIGGPSSMVDQWGSEWQVKPVSIYPQPPPEGHYMLNSSLSARGFADYLAAGAAWLMDEYGMAGISTDGVVNVLPSQNLYAGAGYLDETGALRPTVPLWGTRETMKRLYRLIKGRKPDGLLCNHCSNDLILPLLSFSDIYYTGEHEDYENLAHTRLRFSSKPWGIQAALLGSSEHIYSSSHTMIALLLGTSIFGHGIVDRDDQARKWMNIRKAYLAFDYRSAEWIPYFRNRGLCAAQDPRVKVSLYRHTGKDALLIVGNQEGSLKSVSLKLDLKALGLEGATLQARNALTQSPLPLSADGSFNVLVRPKSFVLVAVDRKP